MDNPNKEIIKEIAQHLECGFDCYFNSTTNEVVPIPNIGQIDYEEEFRESFEAELKRVTSAPNNFIKIEVPESYESYKIMERFVEQLPHTPFRQDLENILQRKAPFRNFKFAIDNSEYRQEWFAFKQLQFEQIVQDQLE
jgi:hypothetical protein